MPCGGPLWIQSKRLSRCGFNDAAFAIAKLAERVCDSPVAGTHEAGSSDGGVTLRALHRQLGMSKAHALARLTRVRPALWKLCVDAHLRLLKVLVVSLVSCGPDPKAFDPGTPVTVM